MPAMHMSYNCIFLGKARSHTRESMKPMSQKPGGVAGGS